MSVFASYAMVYDLLYADKDYEGEARYVAEMIRGIRPGAASLLDLGCGTGRHAERLASMGFDVLGVDRSREMLAEARSRAVVSRKPGAGRLRFRRGDARTMRLREKFDAVTCLFDVVSYQTSDRDVRKTFRTVSSHLEPGGVFIFDCWYGPAVLADPPARRIKKVRGAGVSVVRAAEPVLLADRRIVDVNYRLEVTDLGTGRREVVREVHSMRYFFPEELRELMEGEGLRPHGNYRWMTFEPARSDSWDACFVGVRA